MAVAGPTSATRGKITVTIDSVEISSCFDSGNLDRVEQCCSQLEYKLWTAPDCAGTPYENGNRTWFHFSVNIPEGRIKKVMRFHIQNMNRQSKLYQQRMVPVFRVAVPGKHSWERLREVVYWEMGDEGLILSFEYTILRNHSHKVYFAFWYPFSYCDCQKMLTNLDQKYGLGSRHIYYYRELLCYSLEGRRVDLITLSSLKGIREDREPRLSGLFPDTDAPRAHSFGRKKVFLLTSRVHPGESPASHVLNGLLDFLLSLDDKRAEAIRDNFVVKIIPMLNPDGVAHGHYRTDTRGVNLNRVYLNPDPQLHPSIFAAKSIMLHYHRKSTSHHPVSSEPTSMCMAKEHRPKTVGSAIARTTLHHRFHRSNTYPLDNYVHTRAVKQNYDTQSTNQVCGQSSEQDNEEGGVAIYIDLHAHANKRGCFFYGNFFEDEQKQVENMLYPRLVALNSPHLDFEHCAFSEKNMSSFDKRAGTSKEGTGRVAMYKATGLIHCYTLECNYNSGRKTNAVSSATCDGGRASPALAYSPMPHRYNTGSFEQVGRAVAVALLDLCSLNPWSRLPTSEPRSLAALRNTLAIRIKASRSKARNRELVPRSRVHSSESLLPIIKKRPKNVGTHWSPETHVDQIPDVLSQKKTAMPQITPESKWSRIKEGTQPQTDHHSSTMKTYDRTASIKNMGTLKVPISEGLQPESCKSIKATTAKAYATKQCLLPRRSTCYGDSHSHHQKVGLSRYGLSTKKNRAELSKS